MDLACFVPRRLAADDSGGVHRVPAAMLFADISGYTRLAERLLVQGRAGTELLLDTIDDTFTALIGVVHATGGDVVRFGGDALFVVFPGGDQQHRVDRAVRCAVAMQAVMADRPAVVVPGGRVRLRQTVAVHDGELTVLRWHGPWTEEIVLGEAVTTLLALERSARPGQTVISEETARVGRVPVSTDRGGALVVRSRATTPRRPSPRPGVSQESASSWLPPSLVDALESGIAPEHRAAAVAFVGVDGLDSVAGDRVMEVLVPVMDAVGDAVTRLGVVPLCTDISAGGVAILLTTGAVSSVGDDVERMLGAVRQVVSAGAAAGAHVRAGVNAGLVFAAVIGHPERRTFAALGDTTNVAARIMKAAQVGSVTATLAAMDQTGNWVDPRRTRSLEVSGRRAPVTVVRADERSRGASQPATPLRGRRPELRRLMAALAPGARTVVDVVGPAGSGATRLIAAAIEASSQPVHVVECSIDDLGVPFGVARRVLAELVHGDAGVLPAVASGLGDRPVDVLREVTADRVASSLHARLEGVDIIVIDHADHLDPGSRRVFERLLATSQATFVIAHRGTGGLHPPDDLTIERIELGPLADGDVRALIVDACVRPLGDARLDRLVAVASGNAGLAVRLAAHGDDRQLPLDLTALLAAEVDRVPRHVRDVAGASALTGVEFDHASAAACAAIPEMALLRALGDLDPVVQRLTASRSRFRDPGLAVALVDSLPVAKRRRMARRLAVHLAADAASRGTEVGVDQLLRIARAWDMAEVDEKIVASGLVAGRAAAAIGAADEAADMFGRAWRSALRTTGTAPVDLADLAERWSEAATACGREGEAASALQIASTTVPFMDRRVHLLTLRARAASRAGRYRSASALLRRAERTLPDVDALHVDRAAVTVGLERARLALDRGRLDDAASSVDAMAHITVDLGVCRESAMALALADDIAVARGGHHDETSGRHAHDMAVALDDPLLAGAIACNMGLTADNRGDWAEALHWYATSERHFRRAGSLWSLALVRLNRSTILLELGDADEAYESAVEAHRELAAAGMDAAVWGAATHRARASVRRGAPVEPELATLRQGIERLRALGEAEVAAFREAALVEVLLLAGRPAEALLLAERASVESARFGDRHLLPITTRRLLAMARRALGDLDRAAVEIESALTMADEMDATGERCLCLHAALLIDGECGAVVEPARRAQLADLERRVGMVAHLNLRAPVAR